MRTPLFLFGGGVFRVQTAGRGQRRREKGALAAAACLALLTVLVYAQPAGDPKDKQAPPAGEQPKTEKVDRPTATPAPPVIDIPAPPRPACGSGEPLPGSAEQAEAVDKAGQGQQPTAGPDSKGKGGARWVCEKPTISVEVWSGEPIICNFALRNEGTEDLLVKARGG